MTVELVPDQETDRVSDLAGGLDAELPRTASRMSMDERLLKELVFDEDDVEHSKPSMEKAREFYNVAVMPRQVKAGGREQRHTTGQRKSGVGLFGEPFPLFTKARNLFDIDDATGLYFTGLKRMVKVLVLVGVVNLPNLSSFSEGEYGSFAYNNTDPMMASRPPYSAACQASPVVYNNETFRVRQCPMHLHWGVVDLLAMFVAFIALAMNYRVEDSLIEESNLVHESSGDYTVVLDNPNDIDLGNYADAKPGGDESLEPARSPDVWRAFFERQFCTRSPASPLCRDKHYPSDTASVVAYVTVALDNENVRSSAA